jgi:hypothetical protein
MNIGQLPDLGSLLQLPPGWRYRVETLQQDLSGLPFLAYSSTAPGGATTSKVESALPYATRHARVVWDESENSYQRVGENSADDA